MRRFSLIRVGVVLVLGLGGWSPEPEDGPGAALEAGQELEAGFELYDGPEIRDDVDTWPVHARLRETPTVAYSWLDGILEISARRVDRVGAQPMVIYHILLDHDDGLAMGRRMAINCFPVYRAYWRDTTTPRD